MTDEQTFADYRNRINIKEVLEDAGYTFYKRDGLRYPAYVCLDNNGQKLEVTSSLSCQTRTAVSNHHKSNCIP